MRKYFPNGFGSKDAIINYKKSNPPTMSMTKKRMQNPNKILSMFHLLHGVSFVCWRDFFDGSFTTVVSSFSITDSRTVDWILASKGAGSKTDEILQPIDITLNSWKFTQALRLKIKAAPRQGLANDALVTFCSQWLHIPRQAIHLKAGQSSSQKVLLVENTSLDDFLQCLSKSLK